MQNYASPAAAAAFSSAPAELEVLEGQLTWLVHTIGAVIKGRMNTSGADTQEAMDGELATRVFGMLKVADSGLHTTR